MKRALVGLALFVPRSIRVCPADRRSERKAHPALSDERPGARLGEARRRRRAEPSQPRRSRYHDGEHRGDLLGPVVGQRRNSTRSRRTPQLLRAVRDDPRIQGDHAVLRHPADEPDEQFWWDTSAPPTNVTDSAIQGEVVKYFNHGGAIDASTIYEVFLPASSYSSFGTSDSCGGPSLVVCAYHSNFSHNGTDIKYASMPYPCCGGCQCTGFTTAQNLEHFVCHETREAVTDPDGTAWYDRRGYEADDKCAWSPAPFLGTGGFGYQWEWSNAVSGCVKSQ